MDDLSHLPVRNGFRQRGAEMTRLETFTDAAFAFAVTALVIAGGEIPANFDALIASLKEIPAFAASFLLMVMFWHGHVQWSRRFGLDDTRAVVLSAALVLTVLVYMIPLKVLFGQMFAWVTGGYLGVEFEIADPYQLPPIFVVYGVGYVAMCSLMALLHVHAYSKRDELQLNECERVDTRITIWQWVVLGVPGLLSALVAALAPARIGVWSGFAYMLLPIAMPIFGVLAGKRIEAARLSAQPTAQRAAQSTAALTAQPSVKHAVQPTAEPTVQPTARLTAGPSVQSTAQPSVQPTARPTVQPTVQPTAQPSVQPTAQPTAQRPPTISDP